MKIYLIPSIFILTSSALCFNIQAQSSSLNDSTHDKIIDVISRNITTIPSAINYQKSFKISKDTLTFIKLGSQRKSELKYYEQFFIIEDTSIFYDATVFKINLEKLAGSTSPNRIILDEEESSPLPYQADNLILIEQPFIHENGSIFCTTILTKRGLNLETLLIFRFNSKGVLQELAKLSYV